MFQKNNKIYDKSLFDTHVFTTMFHFNYNHNYTKVIKDHSNTSTKDDIGWSCSIKSFQMCLLNILFKWGFENEFLFELFYKEHGIFSICNFINQYKLLHTLKLGSFFGIYEVISIFQKILWSYKKHHLINIQILSTTDNIIDIEKIDFNQPTVLFFSTQLGTTTVQSYYIDLIKNCFQCKYFEGILGGVNKSSFYFFARHTCIDNLLYLDPHFISDHKSKNCLKDLFANHYMSISMKSISPALTFCFQFTSKSEFVELKKFLEKNTIFNVLNKCYDIQSLESLEDWLLM